MTNEELKQYDLAFGLHSRIPICCIRFFIQEWGPTGVWRREDQLYQQAVEHAKFGYMPCPKCLGKHQKAKIRICAQECGGDHTADFVPRSALDAH